MSRVNDSFYKGHTKQECFSKINPITKLLKDLYNISFYTLNNKGKMKGSQSCQIRNKSSHGTRTVLPKAKADSILSTGGQISSPSHTDNSNHIFNIILFKNRLAV